MATRMDLVIVSGQIRNSVDREEIERGLDHQAKHLVQNLSQSGRQIHGFVHSDPWCEVKLDLDDFSRSRCTCLRHTLCSHTVALFAELNTPWGNPADMLLRRRSLVPIAPSASSGLKRTSAGQAVADRACLARMAAFIRQGATRDAMERGLALEVDGYVGDLDLTSRFLTALVDDLNPARAFLRLAAMEARCECANPQICSHVVAVFAAAYRPHGDPAPILLTDEAATAPVLDAVIAADPERPSLPVPKGAIQDWLAYLQQEWQSDRRRGQKADEARRFHSKMIQYGSEWSDLEDHRQWVLMVHLFVMLKAGQSIAQRASLPAYYLDFGWQELVDEILDAIAKFCQEEASWDTSSAQQRALTLENLVRDSLDNPDPIVDWHLWAYQMLWNAYFPIQHAVRERECLLQSSGTETRVRQLALAHMLSLTGDDHSARKLLGERISVGEEGHLISIAEGRIRAMEFAKAADWLHFVEGQIASYSNYYDQMVRVWEELGKSVAGEEEALERRLRTDLPMTIPHYVEHFLNHGEPKEAFGALMAVGRPPTEVAARALENLWQHHADLMLAWYHQWCDQLVQRKRRDEYQEAAKLLVTLRQQYRKMGRGKDWDRFLELFSRRYGRLKALRDELKRKRIILP